jgi:hypothetical protein
MKRILTFFTFSSLALVASSSLLACGSSDDSGNSQSQSPTNPSSSSGSTSSSTSSGGSSSSSGGSSASACEAVGTRLCKRACACATDGKCYVGTRTDQGLYATINFDNEQKCRDLYVTLGCIGGGEPSFDYATCDKAIEASQCVDGAGGKAILMPDACKTPKKK